MRLTCPSCASEYDVDAAAIGERGRMVRCANCDAEWFQAPAAGDSVAAVPPVADVAPVAAPEPAPAAAMAPMAEPPVSEPVVESSPAPFFEQAPDPAPVVQDYAAASEIDDYRVEPALPSYQSAEADNVERIYYDVAPVAAPRLEEDDVVDETQVRRRKDADRDDLANSLRELEEDHQPRTGGAFLAGFSTVAVMAVILIAVYVKAPDLAKVAPGIEGPLAGYTQMVDQGRFALASATQ